MPPCPAAGLQHRVIHETAIPVLGLALAAWREVPVREALALAAGLGYRAVALDATHPEVRPRSLDRSGRRDLASLLRRHELSLAGLDLWLPPHHLSPGPHAERATDAVLGAIGLVRELAGLVATHAVVNLALPADADPDALEAIRAAGDRQGVPLADHAWPAREDGPVGLDAALAIMAGASPARAVTTLGGRLACARLSDAGAVGRVPVGSAGGSLDVPAFAASLSISAPGAAVVADARMLPDPQAAAASALDAWHRALAFRGP